MAKIKFDNPNEVEAFHAKESWVPVVLGGIPVALVCAAICFIIAGPADRSDLLPIAIVASVIVVLLSRVPHIIKNLQTDVYVTNKRFYHRQGIINIEDHVCDLSSITDVTVDPTVLGRIFNYADVTIQTKAGDDDFVLKEIANAYRMRQTINVSRDIDEDAGKQPAPAAPAQIHRR